MTQTMCMCGNRSVYFRKYSGESLCSSCFVRSIEKKTVNAISRYSMISRNQRVCVGVSGGKDSLALLKILDNISQRRGFEIIPVTIDEGIPGYRNEALEIVANFCKSLDLEHHIRSYKDLFGTTLDDALESKERDSSSCSICGILRRRALDSAAADLDADLIATGHNLDDVIQTMLINMMSGDTSKIAWMDPNVVPSMGIRRIKPFCNIYESEIVFYAFTMKLPFQEESCPHMHEGIRTEVREFFNSLESRHSGIKNNMYHSAMNIAKTMRLTEASKSSSPCTRCGAQCTSSVCSVCMTLTSIEQSAT